MVMFYGQKAIFELLILIYRILSIERKGNEYDAYGGLGSQTIKFYGKGDKLISVNILQICCTAIICELQDLGHFIYFCSTSELRYK
jgi:hypothetical protein